jgi:hypothetical protein
MKICRSQKEFEYWQEKYAAMYGGILVNARLKIIYTPEDKLYQKRYLNRTIKRPKEK